MMKIERNPHYVQYHQRHTHTDTKNGYNEGETTRWEDCSRRIRAISDKYFTKNVTFCFFLLSSLNSSTTSSSLSLSFFFCVWCICNAILMLVLSFVSTFIAWFHVSAQSTPFKENKRLCKTPSGKKCTVSRVIHFIK